MQWVYPGTSGSFFPKIEKFVQTDIGVQINPNFVELTAGFVAADDAIKGTFELIEDESKSGACLWVTKRRGMEYWPTPAEEKKYLIRRSKRNFTSPNFSSITIPSSFEKIVVHTLTHNFRSATKIVRTQLRLHMDSNFALVKVLYAGVNASNTGTFLSGGAPYGFMGLSMSSVSVPRILASKRYTSPSSMCLPEDGVGQINFGDVRSSDQSETPLNVNGQVLTPIPLSPSGQHNRIDCSTLTMRTHENGSDSYQRPNTPRLKHSATKQRR